MESNYVGRSKDPFTDLGPEKDTNCGIGDTGPQLPPADDTPFAVAMTRAASPYFNRLSPDEAKIKWQRFFAYMIEECK